MMAKVGDGGWKPVFRRRQGRHGSSAKLHTLFVDEIPESMNPKGLFTMFSNFGVVKDVYIPEKRRKATRTRFRFVRYDCPVAAGAAIQKANGVWCGDKTLKVKKADFGKVKDLTNSRIVDAKPVGTMRSKVAGFGQRCSYAEVLKGGKTVSGNNIRIMADEYAIGWLLLSAVIKLKPLRSLDDFKIECCNRGLKTIQLREGGGRNVLITFQSKEDMKLLMSSVEDWIMEWCESITEWSKGMRLDNDRFVWLSCIGMPPNLWNVNNFRKIGVVCGEVIEFDHNVLSMKSLKCGKVRICTSHLERIDKMIMLERDGSTYPVCVIEDGDFPVNSMGDGDHCSATYHDSRNEDDDVGNIVADVAKSHAMANSKQLNDVMVGIGHEHTCNLAFVSMVNEKGEKWGTIQEWFPKRCPCSSCSNGYLIINFY